MSLKFLEKYLLKSLDHQLIIAKMKTEYLKLLVLAL